MTVKVNASIHDYEVVNENTAHVIASVTFDSESSVTPEAIRNALRTATNCKLNPLNNSFVKREDGRQRHIISGMMSLSKEVRTLPEGVSVEEATGFSAMSSNMFMDDQENLWELKAEDGRHLIRTHLENNTVEMEQLMASMSSASFSSLSSYDLAASKAINAERACIRGGDFLTFVNTSGAMDQALVAAEISDGAHAGKLLCVSSNGEQILERNCAIMHIEGSQFNEKLDHPEMEVNASVAGGDAVARLTEYYSRLFDYNHEYRDMLLSRIKQHSYA